MIDLDIQPVPGYILVQPYIEPNTMFTSIREVGGESQKSEVIAIGPNLVDDNNIERLPNCKVSDIIIHSYLSEDFSINTTKLRFVHFSNVRGVWKSAPKLEKK